MSLIICSECGNNVSEFADKCPNCGCPIEIIKQNCKIEDEIDGHLYTVINGKKKDVTYFVKTILNDEHMDVNSLIEFNRKMRKELDISQTGLFEDAVKECNGAPKEFNCESMTDFHNRQQSIRSSKPKCPTCGSTNISKISATSKAIGAIGFGLLSKTARSQFKCNKCGYKW